MRSKWLAQKFNKSNKIELNNANLTLTLNKIWIHVNSENIRELLSNFYKTRYPKSEFHRNTIIAQLLVVMHSNTGDFPEFTKDLKKFIKTLILTDEIIYVHT